MTKEPLPITHNAERGARSTCREEPKTGLSLEVSEHQCDCLRVRKIIWIANIERTVWRNIMVIYGDWRIFKRILKHDLALDGASGR